jgi:iron complex transport system permease protein
VSGLAVHRAVLGPSTAGAARSARLFAGLLACSGVLVLVTLAGIAVGAKAIPLSTVIDAIFSYDPANADEVIVRTLRVPRVIVGLLVGAALGAAGTMMQGLTRNPLADPGILGVNAGAALLVVIGIYWFGATSLLGYVWFGFAGAAVASLLVYALGSLGREGATPVKLALAGASLTALLGSITTAILLLDVDTLDQFRFWIVGSLAGRTSTVAASVAPFVAVGLVLALACSPMLNTLALGDDVARGLGQRIGWSRAMGALCIVLLCGAATAAAGPIAFVGLAVPHVARAITGPDYRWLMLYSIVIAPILLIGADIIGRVIARPGEVQVGIVTAFLGAPVFIYLVRRQRISTL